jgi:hypothetical protein
MHPNNNHEVKEHIYFTSLTPISQGGFIMKTIIEIINVIESTNPRSAWNKGVKAYALDILETMPTNVEYGSIEAMKADALNGARDWRQYSESGFALIYNYQIAERLCTPSELKLTNYGMRRPNSREDWIDCQTRALLQAWMTIRRVANGLAPLF